MVTVEFNENDAIVKTERMQKMENITEEAIKLVCKRLEELDGYVTPSILNGLPSAIETKLKYIKYK